MISKEDFENYLCQIENKQLGYILDKVKDIPGDIVELGVWTGNNAIEFMRQSKEKKYYGFDTFNGYTEEDIDGSPNKDDLRENNTGRWGPWEEWNGIEDTKKRLEQFKSRVFENTGYNISDFELVKGDLKKTLPQYVEENKIKQISLLYIDCNVYPAALHGIESAWPAMTEGSVICIDEHKEGGETKAIKEIAEKYNLSVEYTGFKFESGPHSNPSKYIIKK